MTSRLSGVDNTPLAHVLAADECFAAGGARYFVTVTKSKRRAFQNSLGKAARRRGLDFRISNYQAHAGNVIMIQRRNKV